MTTEIKDHSFALRISSDDSRLLEDAVKQGWGSSKGEVVRRLIDMNLRKDTPENKVKLRIMKIFEDNPMEFVVYMYHRLLYLTKTDAELSQEAGLMAFGMKELVTTLFGVEAKDVYELKDDILKTISEPLAPTNIAKPQQSQGAEKQDDSVDGVLEVLINRLRKDIVREKNWQKTVDSILAIMSVAQVWDVKYPIVNRLVEAANIEDMTERWEKFGKAFKDFTLVIPEILVEEVFRKSVLDGLLMHLQ